MRLYLVRHGRTVWNATNKAQGHCDIDLDEAGQQQAQCLASYLCELKIDQVFSSDLARCRQTVAGAAKSCGLKVNYRKDLRERTFGDMEGSDYTELHKWMREEGVRLGVPDWEVRPPNGESMSDVWNRLGPIENELRETQMDTLIVSHGGALAQLLARLMRGTHETPRAFRFDNCGVTVLEKRLDGSFLLVAFNSTLHLNTQ